MLLKCNLKLLTINTRGLRDSVKRKALFLYCKSKRAECILLQETHSNETDETFWATQWGDKIVFSHSTSRSAGVAILFNNCQGKIITTKSDENGYWILTVLQLDNYFNPKEYLGLLQYNTKQNSTLRNTGNGTPTQNEVCIRKHNFRRRLEYG